MLAVITARMIPTLTLHEIFWRLPYSIASWLFVQSARKNGVKGIGKKREDLPPLAGTQKTEIENNGQRKRAMISRTIGRVGNSHQISGRAIASLITPQMIAPKETELFSSQFISFLLVLNKYKTTDISQHQRTMRAFRDQTCAAVQQARTELISLGAVSFGGLGLKDAIAQTIRLGKEMEMTRIAFNTMLGSAEKGAQTIALLQKFADLTPFNNDEVIKSV